MVSDGQFVNLPDEKDASLLEIAGQSDFEISSRTLQNSGMHAEGTLPSQSNSHTNNVSITDASNSLEQVSVALADQQATIIRAIATGDISAVSDMGSIEQIKGILGDDLMEELLAENKGLVEGFFDMVAEVMDKGTDQALQLSAELGDPMANLAAPAAAALGGPSQGQGAGIGS